MSSFKGTNLKDKYLDIVDKKTGKLEYIPLDNYLLKYKIDYSEINNFYNKVKFKPIDKLESYSINSEEVVAASEFEQFKENEYLAFIIVRRLDSLNNPIDMIACLHNYPCNIIGYRSEYYTE